MATFEDGPYLTRIAGADLSTSQHLIVKQQTDATYTRSLILATASTDELYGVLYTGQTTGGNCTVRARNSQGTFKVLAGGTVTIGDALTADSTSRAVTTTSSGDQIIGFAEESGVVGQLIEYRAVNRKY